jgi:hypothetical protein
MTSWNLKGDMTDKYLNTDDIVVEFSEKEDRKTQSIDWLNWVSLDMDEKNDAIHMHLSTGDPRGSQFSISLTRPRKWIQQTKCLIFDAREDNNYSPIYETNIFGKIVMGNPPCNSFTR